MAKRVKTRYVCQSCGFESLRWTGKCPDCNQWNTLVEEIKTEDRFIPSRPSTPRSNKPVPITDIAVAEKSRIMSGIDEFDRVLGEGITPGSLVLVGGAPGIGKSTLMLQVVAKLSEDSNKKNLYVSGEESPRQIKMRCHRLGIVGESLLILSETNLGAIIEIAREEKPEIMVIDSIQTVYLDTLESSPGSVSQVRESANVLMNIAKNEGITVFLIGHVTKEGSIAGPKVMEHIVDTVLQLEGDRHYFYRILRAMKNRFGSTNEIGVFEMRQQGLVEVNNPSEIFLSERSEEGSGTVVVCSLEGTRPMLHEIQGLVVPTSYGMPQRTSTGFDYRRLTILLAVLEKRVGLRLRTHDVFVNLVGGMRIDEPAIDLGVAVAIASSFKNKPVHRNMVAIGEVGLGGEIRGVGQIEKRIQEAEKLGFEEVIIPKKSLKGLRKFKNIEVVGIDKVSVGIDLMMKFS